MIFIVAFLSLVFMLVGFAVTPSNARYMLSGYNTMSEEERKGFDLPNYLLFFRKFHVFLAVSLLLLFVVLRYLFDSNSAEVVVVMYPLLAYAFFVWKAGKYNQSSRKGFSSRITPWVAGILVLISLGIGVMMYSGLMDSRMIVNGNEVEITGMYGQKIQLSAIEEIEVVEELPVITWKINGFALGSQKKGYFRTKEGRTVKLFVNTNVRPYLKLQTAGEEIYLSSAQVDVQELRRELTAR
jgi:hypothetical protein